MKQVFILVEGQTEEVIVNDVLVPPARARGFVLTPTVVITSATPTCQTPVTREEYRFCPACGQKV